MFQTTNQVLFSLRASTEGMQFDPANTRKPRAKLVIQKSHAIYSEMGIYCLDGWLQNFQALT